MHQSTENNEKLNKPIKENVYNKRVQYDDIMPQIT